MPNVLAVLAVAGIASCTARARPDRPPTIRYGDVACARCGMLISEEAAAAARVRDSGEADLYDDLGCLIQSTRATGGRIWVHDEPTAAWIDATEAYFVEDESQRTPMGFGIAAFAQVQAAQARADALGGQVMRLEELVQRIAHLDYHTAGERGGS